MNPNFTLCLEIENLKFTNADLALNFKGKHYISHPQMQIIYNFSSQDGKEKVIIELAKAPENWQLLKGKRAEIFYIEIKTLKKFQERKMLISKIIQEEGSFFIELAPISSLLSGKKAKYFSQKCRAEFGDFECMIDLKNYSLKGVIEEISEDYTEILDYNLKIPINLNFDNGKILLHSSGEELPILRAEDTKIILFFEASNFLKTGEKFTIFASCEKTIEACKKFKNVKNFRGEPFIFEKFSSSSFEF